MTVQPFIYRKELADLAQVHESTLRRNEDEWGLDKCRKRVNSRVIRYKRKAAIAILRRVGLIF